MALILLLCVSSIKAKLINVYKAGKGFVKSPECHSCQLGSVHKMFVLEKIENFFTVDVAYVIHTNHNSEFIVPYQFICNLAILFELDFVASCQLLVLLVLYQLITWIFSVFFLWIMSFSCSNQLS